MGEAVSFACKDLDGLQPHGSITFRSLPASLITIIITFFFSTLLIYYNTLL